MSNDLATGSIDYAIEEVSRLKVCNKQYFIDDSLFHLRKAKECLTEGLKNSQEWMQDTQEVAKMVLAMIPLLLLMKDQNSKVPHARTRLASCNSRVEGDHTDEV